MIVEGNDALRIAKDGVTTDVNERLYEYRSKGTRRIIIFSRDQALGVSCPYSRYVPAGSAPISTLSSRLMRHSYSKVSPSDFQLYRFNQVWNSLQLVDCSNKDMVETTRACSLCVQALQMFRTAGHEERRCSAR
jgi:hypothetical protein